LERTITRAKRRGVVAAAIAVVASAGLVMTAGPALAHHPEIVASATCAPRGESFNISYTATAWEGWGTAESRTNPDVRITVRVDGGPDIQKDSGAFAAPAFSFSGTFTVPATATSVVVTATAVGAWGNPDANDTGPRSTGLLTLPTGCTVPAGDDGCTPGYWKNHVESWTGTGYSPTQTAASVFSGATAYGLGSTTLLVTLDGGGGKGNVGAAKILLRAATAAALNAASTGVDYPRTTTQVISAVNAALASNDRATILDLAADLDADNNLGCTLS